MKLVTYITLIATRVRHQGHSEFGDDTVVGLREKATNNSQQSYQYQPERHILSHWTISIGKDLPARAIRHSTHASTDELAGWKDDFKAGMASPVYTNMSVTGCHKR